MNLMERSNITRPNIDLSRKFTDAGSNSVEGFKRLSPEHQPAELMTHWLRRMILLRVLGMEMERQIINWEISVLCTSYFTTF